MSVRDSTIVMNVGEGTVRGWLCRNEMRHKVRSYVDLPRPRAEFSRSLLTYSSNKYVRLAPLLGEKLPIFLNCLYQIHTEVFDLRPEKSLPGKSGLFSINRSKHCAFSCVFMAADLKVTQEHLMIYCGRWKSLHCVRVAL